MPVMNQVQIPVVTLSDYTHGSPEARQRFIQTFGDGLKEFGFITLQGHAIDHTLIRKAYELYQEFFSMDLATKKRYDNVAGGQRGYTSFGKEHAKNSSVGDLKEFWHTGPELPADHPYRAEYPNNVWPEELPELKEIMTTLYGDLQSTAEIMLEALGEYFGLPKETFRDMVKDGNSIIRSIHYPPLEEGMDPQAVRAAAHEDINMITLLCEATEAGLEILTHDGEWVGVSALSGQIVVDAGDMLSRVTNEVIPSTTHRVVNPQDGRNVSRYSMPFFVHPYSSCDLTVLDRFVSEETPAKFPPITAGAFLEQRLREIGLLK
ncbi:Deacetoxycephalosporin C hydroxylase [compost metagenome]